MEVERTTNSGYVMGEFGGETRYDLIWVCGF